MIRILFLAIFMCFSLIAISQEIGIEKKFLSKRKYYFEGEKISRSEVEKIVEDTPLALQQVESGRVQKRVAAVFMVGAGVCLGYNVYNLTTRDPISTDLLVFTGALVVVSSTLATTGNKRFERGVKRYNYIYNTRSSLNKKIDLQLAFGQHGVGIRLKF